MTKKKTTKIQRRTWARECSSRSSFARPAARRPVRSRARRPLGSREELGDARRVIRIERAPEAHKIRSNRPRRA